MEGLPEWIGTGISIPFFVWLWFQERSDRREAEQRERDTIRETTARLDSGLDTLSRATAAVMDARGRQR